METMIAYCGLECSQCPAFIAGRENDNELRVQTARAWSEQFNVSFAPESIDCSGCQADGVHGPYCSMCAIRACAKEKGVATCAHCPDYGCDMLAKVHSMDAQCRVRLNEIRKRVFPDC